MAKDKIRIRLKSGKWIAAPAYATSSRYLFVTPERERDILPNLQPSKRGRFLKDRWCITHRPSGYSIIPFSLDLAEARRLAELFAESSIPWGELRSKKTAVSYGRIHKAIMRKFEKERGHGKGESNAAAKRVGC